MTKIKELCKVFSLKVDSFISTQLYNVIKVKILKKENFYNPNFKVHKKSNLNSRLSGDHSVTQC